MKFASFALTLSALLSKGSSASTFSDGKNIRGKVEDQGTEQRALQKGSGVPCKPKDENDTGLQYLPDPERLPKVVGGKAQCINNIVQASGRQYPCDNVDLLSFIPFTDLENSDFTFANANDIWGWTDPLNNVEYAIIGLTTGTSFVSLADPENPVVLGKLPTATSNSSWRDIKVYNNRAYIVSEAPGHGLQIFDLTQLRTTTSFTTFSATATENSFSNAHNIFINEDSGKAYVVGSNTCSGGLRVYDISNLQPVLDSCYGDRGYTHDVQCVVYSGPDVDYQGKEICFASNEEEVDIICMDCANEKFLGTTTVSNPQYIHQGWLSEDQKYFFVNDELDEYKGIVPKTHTYVFDVSNLNSPFLHYTYVGDVNSIDHNNYVKGNFLYQANYRHGLRVLEGTADNPSTSNPMTEVAYFDIHPESDGNQFNGAWSNFPYYDSGVVVVSSIERGLYVLKPNLGEDPPSPSTSAPSLAPSDSPSNKPPTGPSGPWDIELSGTSPPITTTIDGQMYILTTYEATDKDYGVQVFDSTCSGDPIDLFNEIVSHSPLSSGEIEIEARLEIDIGAIQANPYIYTDFGSGSGEAVFCVEAALYLTGTKVVKHRAVFSADVSVVEGFFTLSNVALFGENPTTNNDLDIGYSGSVNVYLCDYETMDEVFDMSVLGSGDELTVCVENSDSTSDSIIDSIWQMDMEGFANGLTANFDVITDGQKASGNSDLIEYKCDSVLGKCAVSVVVIQAFFQQGTETSLEVSGDAILGSGLSKNNDEENSFSLSLKLDGGCEGGFLRSIMNGIFKG